MQRYFVGNGVKGFLHPKGSYITLQNCCYCGTLGRSIARHYLLVCHKMQWSCLHMPYGSSGRKYRRLGLSDLLCMLFLQTTHGNLGRLGRGLGSISLMSRRICFYHNLW